MKKVLMFLLVSVIIYLSCLMPNILFAIEDLKMESKVYIQEEKNNKIDVQAENIYLVKAIHDIEDRTI